MHFAPSLFSPICGANGNQEMTLVRAHVTCEACRSILSGIGTADAVDRTIDRIEKLLAPRHLKDETALCMTCHGTLRAWLEGNHR